ncbi:FxsB family cyclophane-forming radical SAM/SPASM peptide maturase [Streptomyces sp. NPDC051907]|uniref:FxsB family cyclophane-forming radical SAM/SPASM peptide maturase n=1 Tax=Streptomyces sp. NPDC051907 TaxID=3155284 RepID=UPI003449087A
MPAGTRPFRQFVLKVHSRCDLACDHCYVYEHADQSWRGRPVTMSEEILRLAARRIAEHAAAHGLPRVHVVLHGGEPLLVGRERLRGFARVLRSELRGVSDVVLRMQTNGLRLDDAYCAMLAEEGIVAGVSIDGDRASHDRHRVRADGTGSYDDVVRAVRRLAAPAYRSAFGGLLCTVDVENDPVDVYRALVDLDPPGIDFLLPHATWDRPPPRPGGESDYADWLIAVHRRWTEDGKPVRIRMFDSISRLSHGGLSLTEALGLGSSDLLVVETDGAIEQADWLKTVAHGAPETGFHVARDPFDAAAEHPGILAQRRGLDGLSAQCRACPAVAVCGGGLYAHRYRTPPGSRAGGFDNPSVYCADLLKLIQYVEGADDRAPSHGLRRAHFDDLAAGYGDAPAVQELAQAQSSLRRVLLAAAHRVAPYPLAAWDFLLALPSHALDAVLADPYLRVWALGVCEEGAPDPGRPAEIALAAAARTGSRLSLAVPLREGTVHLPGLGRLVVDGPARDVTVSAYDGLLAVDGAALGALPDGFVWEPLRYLEADGIRVALEDVDPYRTGYQAEVRPRLTAAEFRSWQEAFRGAWPIVLAQYPRYADGLAAGLRAVTPLAAPPGRIVSETSRHAFGAIGVALPPCADDLALTLIHEFQHVKLGALQDMYDLFEPGGGRYHVAWRTDPRPLDAVLQGTYAHLAVADVWRTRARRETRGARPEDAAGQAEFWRGAVLAALDTLSTAGAPTGVGERLLAGMRATARSLGGGADAVPLAGRTP